MADPTVPTHTISMASSKYGWEDVDERAKQLGMDRSKYIQSLAEKDLSHKRFERVRITEVLILLGMATIILLLLVILQR